jgi:WD40 repeat protein
VLVGILTVVIILMIRLLISLLEPCSTVQIQHKKTIPVSNSIVDKISFFPDEKTFAVLMQSGNAFVCDVGKDVPQKKLAIEHINRMEVEPSGNAIALADQQGNAFLFDVGRKRIVQRWASPKLPMRPISSVEDSFLDAPPLVSALAFSPDGHFLAISYMCGLVRVCRVANGGIERELSLSGAGRWLRFTEQGRHLFVQWGQEGQMINDYDITTWQLIRQIDTGHDGWVGAVALSKDETKLATGGYDCRVKVWDVRTGRLQSVFQHETRIDSLAFSEKNQWLAAGTEDAGGLKVWDISSGKVLCHLLEQNPLFFYLWDCVVPKFVLNDQFLCTWTEDGSIRFWCTNTWRVYQHLQHTNDRKGYSAFTFSSDGYSLLLGRYDGNIELWSLEQKELSTP